MNKKTHKKLTKVFVNVFSRYGIASIVQPMLIYVGLVILQASSIFNSLIGMNVAATFCIGAWLHVEIAEAKNIDSFELKFIIAFVSFYIYARIVQITFELYLQVFL